MGGVGETRSAAGPRATCQDRIEQRSESYGQSARGHGYHKGFGDGAKQGGVVGALITLGATGLVVGGKWAVGKLRERSMAKQLDSDAATEPLVGDEPGTPTDATD